MAEIKLFNQNWTFLKTALGTELSDIIKRKGEFRAVDVPHDWLIYDSENLYENGTGWYLKTFSWNKKEEQRVFLVFDGVYMDSAVYVNGSLAMQWKYGYSAFEFDITDFLIEGENRIMVRVDYAAPNSRWYSV